ncbi:hypothetical protein SCLCIDRAFT_107822 [Scleroderma citrinum Foug A]|uniref:HAT C-terminal dimerisation domain-containing protein n=1 Tax=Scleroderma citrinum Foug A TaxID=1036808 RepID=A0A0C3E3S0_9AGAM|nr:hypothetical protein SCLCIDRAFT_107822 [Scleroderma citrinum Foug A]
MLCGFFLMPSVKVEHLFSKGQIVLLYLRNCLLSQSTWALLCLGQWSKLGLIKNDDIRKATCDEVKIVQECIEVSG